MSAAALLRTSALRKAYGGVVAVKDVDLQIAERERICVIGPNGAGKSSLVGLLSGTLKPSSGAVELHGMAMAGRPLHEYCRRGIVRKFQGTNTFQWLSVRDNLVMAGLAAAANHGVAPADPDEILDLVKLVPQRAKAAEAISHGQRQWLEVGMTLMARPKLLLLDEPTAGMTVEGTQDMAVLIERLGGRFAVVVIEHDLAFVRRMNCRTIVMHQGAIIRDGAFADIEQDEEVRDIYLGRGKSHAGH